MAKEYIYNIKTRKLHYKGYCYRTKYIVAPDNFIFFDTEDEALAYDGRAVSVCKNCAENRDNHKQLWL